MNKKQVGNTGEVLAQKFLAHQGYEILATNYRIRFGEVDIVVRRDTKIFFIEVKTRLQQAFGSPEDAVNRRKLMKIVRAGHSWLIENQLTPEDVGGILVVSIEKINGRILVKCVPVDI